VKEQSEAPPTEKLESFALDSPNAASSPEPSSGEEDNVEEVEAAATTAAALAAAAALKFNLNNRSWLDVVSKTVPLKSLLLQSTSSSNMSAVSLLRHPLHEKLSSPARLPARALSASRPSSAPVAAPHQAAAESDSNSTEALKRFEQASQRRQQIVDQRRQALREKNERVYVVAERMAASRDARRAQIVGAQTKAGKLHNRHIETIVQRAANQNEKVSEVAFITSIEADLARREMDQRQEASEARRRQVHQQRADQPKLQPAKRESAAAARRLELLAQRDQKAAQKRRKMEEVALRRQQLPSSVKAGENVETVAPAVATPAEPAPVELNPELINIPDPVEITVPAVVPPSPAKADSDSSPVKKSKKSAVSVIVKAPALSAKQRKRAEAAEEALLNAAMQAAAAAAAPVIRSEPEPKSRASSASKRQVVLPEESALATVDAMKKRNRRQQLQLRASTAANGGKPTTDNSRLVTASTLRTRMSSVVSRLRSCLGPSPTSAATGSSWAQELHTASPELSACAAQLEANLDAAVLSMQQQGSAEQATVELASAVSEDVVQLLKSDSFRVALPKRFERVDFQCSE
jgi:Pyruvate/2-oxoacid:ferredoxin oxidoreductase gamma subunit